MHVLIRVDASPAIGIGHSMRCATLAHELRQRDHAVTIASAELVPLVEARFRQLGASLATLGSASRFVDLIDQADVAVVDGYHLADELAVAADSDVPVAVIDDNRELDVARADLVVNQNLHALEVGYEATTAPCLLGPDYALIRPDVVALARRAEATTPVQATVLVAIGGTDPRGLTAGAVDGLLARSSHRLVIADGSSEDVSIGERVYRSSPDLLDAFLTADVALIGGGSTMWEVAYLGIPAVAAIVADNQRSGASAAEMAGFVAAVDCLDPRHRCTEQLVSTVLRLCEDTPRREAMREAGSSVFDGRGASRITDALEELAAEQPRRQ